jgi:hypothetical protein
VLTPSEILERAGYTVDLRKNAPSKDELLQIIGEYSAVGLRYST